MFYYELPVNWQEIKEASGFEIQKEHIYVKMVEIRLSQSIPLTVSQIEYKKWNEHIKHSIVNSKNIYSYMDIKWKESQK